MEPSWSQMQTPSNLTNFKIKILKIQTKFHTFCYSYTKLMEKSLVFIWNSYALRIKRVKIIFWYFYDTPSNFVTNEQILKLSKFLIFSKFFATSQLMNKKVLKWVKIICLVLFGNSSNFTTTEQKKKSFIN